ncbi:MAG TPA: plastocyanin/azurin family copper-binding protein, partial [Vicinamibacterales bacterium]
EKWIAGLDESDPEYEHHLLEALWVYQHHDVVEQGLLKRLLNAREFRARAAAVRALHHWFDRVDGAMTLLGRAVNDPAPRVRLEAVRALSFIPTAEAAAMALEALKHPMDYYLSYTLDSTIATLEPHWKPALGTGGLLTSLAPDALDYLLDRLEPEELAALPRSTPVFEALLGRAGVPPEHRREAIHGLARAHNRSFTTELVDAIRRLDGVPGHHGALADLATMLATTERAELGAIRPDLEKLARSGRSEVVRQGAFAAIVAADGGVNAAWKLTAGSPRGRVDLLNAAVLVADPGLRTALAEKIAALLGEARSASLVEPSLPGRYVRIVLPGPNRTLRLAEVQVFEGATNVAPQGKATQSSIVAGGAIGGHPEGALDGKLGDSGSGESEAFTDEEHSPWWEVDLGSVRKIDRIVVSAAGDGARGDGLHVSVLDANREPVITRDGLRPRSGTSLLLGGDFTADVQTAAIRSLAVLREGDPALVTLVAPFVRDEATREAAVAAIRTVPADGWPEPAVKPLLDDVLAYVRSVPPADRTGAAFTQALALGRDLAARLPVGESKQASAALGRLAVRTIRIEAVPAQMKFDIGRFIVAAGEEIEIEFVNRDEMPHNLLITIPGALETVSLKAEEMAKEPDAFAKGFNPGGPEVLHATPLINGGETARLRFTAPTEPDSYPFVCTFPGHWRTMNGTMQVVAPPLQTAGR